MIKLTSITKEGCIDEDESTSTVFVSPESIAVIKQFEDRTRVWINCSMPYVDVTERADDIVSCM